VRGGVKYRGGVSLQRLVDRHALLGFEKQLHAYEVIGEASWWVDLDAGTITFDGELEMRAGLLGTEAGTWLWGWANPGSFPVPVVADARHLTEYGHEHEIPELIEPELALTDDVSLDRIGLVASGVLALDATYNGPLDEDARILLALGDPSLALPAPEPARLSSVLATVVQAGWVRDWTVALAAYAAQRELGLERAGDAVVLGGVRVTLDDDGRVAEISG
jgi:hypothetical protein